MLSENFLNSPVFENGELGIFGPDGRLPLVIIALITFISAQPAD